MCEEFEVFVPLLLLLLLLLLQSYMPEMAYHGIVTGYNRHGARVHLVGSEYHAALLQAAGLQAGPAAATATAAAVKPGMHAAAAASDADKRPQEVPVGVAAGPQQQAVPG
jgi:hypothetical protein